MPPTTWLLCMGLFSMFCLPGGSSVPLQSRIHACWHSVVRQGHTGGLCAPHAKTGRLKAELPRAVRGLVLDLVDADRVFEDHAIRALKIEEARARRRVPAGAEHNL